MKDSGATEKLPRRLRLPVSGPRIWTHDGIRQFLTASQSLLASASRMRVRWWQHSKAGVGQVFLARYLLLPPPLTSSSSLYSTNDWGRDARGFRQLTLYRDSTSYVVGLHQQRCIIACSRQLFECDDLNFFGENLPLTAAPESYSS